MNRPTSVSAPLHNDADLIRAVGLFALTAAIINVVVGGGIFRLPSSIAANLGPAAPTAFLIGALAIIPITLCFAAAGSRVVSSGGPYSYLAAAFGPFPGFLTGALMWICNLASGAGVAVALSEQVARVWPVVGEPVARSAFLAAVYAVLIALNAFGVRFGARTIVVLAAVKLAPLFALAAVGLYFVDWSQVQLGAIPSWRALGASMVMVMFAYSGIETALSSAGETRDPARNVPRAALSALAIVVMLYVALQVVNQGVLGARLPGETAPLAVTAGALWPAAFGLLLVAAGVSMFGFLMGNLLGSSRIAFALGRDGYLPSAVGNITRSHRVPLVAVVLHGTIAWLLASAGSFEFLVMVSGGANCLVYAAVGIAAWKLQRDGRAEQGTPFQLPGGIVVPLLAVVAMVAVLSTLSTREWSAITASLALLMLIYAMLHWLRVRSARTA